jgi:putative aldouronate transport system substrate-binding protein
MIPCIYAIQDEAFIASNYTARGDWLDELGLDNENIITWDDVHEMLTLFKLNYCAFPFPLLTRIDMAGNYAFTSFDTLPYVSESVGPMYVVDGKVTFSNMNDNDKELATLLNQWFEEGLIDPNWASYANNQSFVDKTVGNEVGYVYMSPGEVDGYERGNTNDPDARWDPIHKPLKTPDQVVHVGGEKARLWYGSAVISPKCENIELAVTWIDWRYSPSGSFAVSYGPEGVLWETDENGNMVATDEALNPEDGLAFAWACNLYGLNPLAEPGLAISARKYIVPGGDRMLAIHYFWDDYNYDGAYEWPTGIKLTQEQTEEVNQYAADLGTFVTENYSGFIDGSKPLSEWDSYVAELKNLGIETVIAIYQKAYDDYMEFLASF